MKKETKYIGGVATGLAFFTLFLVTQGLVVSFSNLEVYKLSFFVGLISGITVFLLLLAGEKVVNSSYPKSIGQKAIHYSVFGFMLLVIGIFFALAFLGKLVN